MHWNLCKHVTRKWKLHHRDWNVHVYKLQSMYDELPHVLYILHIIIKQLKLVCAFHHTGQHCGYLQSCTQLAILFKHFIRIKSHTALAVYIMLLMADRAIYSFAKLQSPPLSVLSFYLYDKIYHKQEVSFLFY